MIGLEVEGGFRVTEELHDGVWMVARGADRDGHPVLISLVPEIPGARPLAETARALALPFDGIPALRALVPVTTEYDRFTTALVETEPAGTSLDTQDGPFPIADVLTLGLDLARLVARVHAAGEIFGTMRPQLTYVTRAGGRLSLAGTTPRSERYGLASFPKTRAGAYSPFLFDMFLGEELARALPPSPASDVCQLGMMLHRLATGASPFHGDDGMMQELLRAIQGTAPPWNLDDPRAIELERLARAAFTPGRSRALAPLLEFLERAA